MNFLHRIQHWGDSHHPKWLDIVRIILGIFLCYECTGCNDEQGILWLVCIYCRGAICCIRTYPWWHPAGTWIVYALCMHDTDPDITGGGYFRPNKPGYAKAVFGIIYFDPCTASPD